MNNTDSVHSRRSFLKSSASAVATAALAGPFVFSRQAQAEINSDTLKLGLIGCGGRGTGAIQQALKADKNSVLWAMGDLFPDALQRSWGSLGQSQALVGKLAVSQDRQFTGLDAFQKVIDSGVDVVLLTTPPGFRPQHLRAAVKARKHVFCEKPVATDAPGVRSIMESCRMAKKQGTAVTSGFCWRYNTERREFVKRIHDGQIGDVQTVYSNYFTGRVKPMPADSARKPGMTDLEWQVRNWYNFVWTCGDSLVEQAAHSVDKISWITGNLEPTRCVATGGRAVPNHSGTIFDHFAVYYEYEGGARTFLGSRQIDRCYNENSDYVYGTKGTGAIEGWTRCIIRGEAPWRFRGQKNNMYQTEHDELFASIRRNEPVNDGEWMSRSTMMAIMGRTAAYTGQAVTWKEIMASEDAYVPAKMSWDMTLPVRPMAMPGQASKKA